MKSKEELDNQVENLKKYFGNARYLNLNIAEIKNNFKEYFNEDILKLRTKWFIDLSIFFKSADGNKWRKRFNNERFQPITITYKRCDLIFFTWDNYLEYGEDYFVISTKNNWCKNIYPYEIKKSELFKLKFDHLREIGELEELYIQMRIIDFNNFDNRINVIDDLDYE